MGSQNIRVAVNGYGVIGKRVADAVRALCGAVTDPQQSVTITDRALGVRNGYLS